MCRNSGCVASKGVQEYWLCYKQRSLEFSPLGLGSGSIILLPNLKPSRVMVAPQPGTPIGWWQDNHSPVPNGSFHPSSTRVIQCYPFPSTTKTCFLTCLPSSTTMSSMTSTRLAGPSPWLYCPTCRPVSQSTSNISTTASLSVPLSTELEYLVGEYNKVVICDMTLRTQLWRGEKACVELWKWSCLL